MSDVPKQDGDRVPLTREVIEILRAHRQRTGKGPQALFRPAPVTVRGLCSKAAARWLNGHESHAPKPHLHYVLTRYTACPDSVCTASGRTSRNLVRKELRRTRIGDDELRLLLNVEQKRSWQFLSHDKLTDALELLNACLHGREYGGRANRRNACHGSTMATFGRKALITNALQTHNSRQS